MTQYFGNRGGTYYEDISAQVTGNKYVTNKDTLLVTKSLTPLKFCVLTLELWQPVQRRAHCVGLPGFWFWFLLFH